MGEGMEVVDVMYAGERQGVGRMLGDAGAFPEFYVKILLTHDYTPIQVRSCG